MNVNTILGSLSIIFKHRIFPDVNFVQFNYSLPLYAFYMVFNFKNKVQFVSYFVYLLCVIVI